MPGTNPALAHQYKLTVDGVDLSPIKLGLTGMSQKQKTVELSDLSVLVTDRKESSEFSLTFDSDNTVDLAIVRSLKATLKRTDATLQVLDNAGTTPVLVYQLGNFCVSDEKPTQDLDRKGASDPVNVEFTCHAKVTTLPS
jgi:hypothetical protein